MLNRFRRVQTVLLIFCLCTALTLPAYAGGTSTQEHAALLSSLNLFRGTGTASDGSPVYSLHNLPTRLQGLIMLVRLLGAEEEALALDGITPFTDVSNFTDAARYISYAYENGITNGTSPVTFTPGGTLTVNAYMAFLLRALGYTETDEDFSWGQQLEFALSIGMITQKSVPLLRSAELTRGIMVDLSYAALTCQRKNESRTLAEKLCQDGIFTEEQGIRAGVLGHGAGWTYDYVLTDDSTVDYERKNVYTTGGNVTAHVLTVNVSNPSVTVRAVMVDNTLGHTAPFPEIVENSGALVAGISSRPTVISKFRSDTSCQMGNFSMQIPDYLHWARRRMVPYRSDVREFLPVCVPDRMNGQSTPSTRRNRKLPVLCCIPRHTVNG